ncbi:hypothetical protein [Streptomyces huasconensis]|uniref:hypothetical protein n=1 Tax=Streptomyces huasconensis TaxID=1854574 RepID=UPI0033F1F572
MPSGTGNACPGSTRDALPTSARESPLTASLLTVSPDAKTMPADADEVQGRPPHLVRAVPGESLDDQSAVVVDRHREGHRIGAGRLPDGAGEVLQDRRGSSSASSLRVSSLPTADRRPPTADRRPPLPEPRVLVRAGVVDRHTPRRGRRPQHRLVVGVVLVRYRLPSTRPRTRAGTP